MSNAPDYGQGQATLSKAAGLVTDAKADFIKESDTLSGQIADMQGKWVGQGASAFFVLHQTWTEKQRTILNALDEFAQSLQKTEQVNMTNDDEQNAVFARLNGRLG
ncbi:WXG100 family type VII secretion target [Nocardioides rubriscoriae]|uniref:WXG100 family type VII secretion target n=1 Tax=Nocardioides rubriscoriae TaxID=642762 RepID=UPI001478EFAE|nr:WXG100 family type VII secretion target [Nocardioides rubriscoriae]